MEFDWDKEKAESNFKKRGVNFDEASTVFGDPLARIFDDDKHLLEEKREIMIGHSLNNRLLFVYFTERENDVVRIIGARLPTPKERKEYEENAGSQTDEMKDEYNFDYSTAKPNRFAEKYKQIRPSVMLDSDVAEVFPDSASVNEALRFLIRVAQENKPSFEIQK